MSSSECWVSQHLASGWTFLYFGLCRSRCTQRSTLHLSTSYTLWHFTFVTRQQLFGDRSSFYHGFGTAGNLCALSCIDSSVSRLSLIEPNNVSVYLHSMLNLTIYLTYTNTLHNHIHIAPSCFNILIHCLKETNQGSNGRTF